jgi:hypothetical protein
MSNHIIRAILVTFTLLYGTCVVLVFGSDRLHSMSLAVESGKISPERGIALIDAAIKLDPLSAELYSRKYAIFFSEAKKNKLKAGDLSYEIRLQFMARAIALCPAWPAYHFHYALTVEKVTPRLSKMAVQHMLSEFKKAATLGPTTQRYKDQYESRLKKYK